MIIHFVLSMMRISLTLDYRIRAIIELIDFHNFEGASVTIINDKSKSITKGI